MREQAALRRLACSLQGATRESSRQESGMKTTRTGSTTSRVTRRGRISRRRVPAIDPSSVPYGPGRPAQTAVPSWEPDAVPVLHGPTLYDRDLPRFSGDLAIETS
jgi:hypothetical protein